MFERRAAWLAGWAVSLNAGGAGVDRDPMTRRDWPRGVARRLGRDVQVSVGGALFLAAGVTVALVLELDVPVPEHVERGGLQLLAVALAAAGLALLGLPHAAARHAPPFMAGAAIAACTAGLLLNGERHGGDPLFNDVLYIWPALYVGYAFATRHAVLAIAGTGAAYAAALSAIPQPVMSLAPRFVVVFAAVVSVGGAMHLLRRHVNALVGSLTHTARTDGLTGLLNRRAFDEQLRGELNRAIRTQTPFCLLLGDIDFFKKLNDDHGHAAGDAALKHVAAALRQGTRDMDTVGRVGGEEFAVILPATEMRDAIAIAERLRAAITAGSRERRLTMSVGAVSAPKHGLHPDELLKQADQALYTAKEAGRDRTVTPEWRPPSSEPTLRERVQEFNRLLGG